MTVEDSVFERLAKLEADREAAREGSGLSGVGGGDEPPYLPGLEPPVAELEASLIRIEVMLVGIGAHVTYMATAGSVQTVRTEIATLAGELDGKATATDLAELRGRVGRIPTVPVPAGLLALATAVITARPWIASPHRQWLRPTLGPRHDAVSVMPMDPDARSRSSSRCLGARRSSRSMDWPTTAAHHADVWSS